MITFMKFVEAIGMPKSMGSAKVPVVPDLSGGDSVGYQAEMHPWSVQYMTTTQVMAKSEAEVRRILWEFLSSKKGWGSAAELEHAAKTAVITPMGDQAVKVKRARRPSTIPMPMTGTDG